MKKPDTVALGAADLRQVSPGIFYSTRPFVVASQDLVEFLKQNARNNGIGRARMCAHSAPEGEQHDMLIVSHHDTYVVPHRHLDKSESFTVIEGEADVLLFDDEGAVITCFSMGPATSGLPFFYRMPARQFHSLDIKSEFLVFVESTRGPFLKEAMESAPWAPAADDSKAGRAFIRTAAASHNKHASVPDGG